MCFNGVVANIDGGTNVTIDGCKANVTITGSGSGEGGILAYSSDSNYEVKSDYWLSTCGETYGIGSTSANTNTTKYTADQMKLQSNFVDWDFDAIWKMDETKGYPRLQWEN